MSKITVVNHVSLDGVMQAPGTPEEDTRGGFAHGGWAAPNNDEVMAREMGKGIGRQGSLLFGRWTYEKFYEVWPNRADGNPFTDLLTRTNKYVVSSSLREPLPWENSTLLTGDAVEAVARVKSEDEGHITVLGSQKLLETLIPAGLVDEYVLQIHPLVLGSGTRLFPHGTYQELELVDSVTTTKGVLIGTYRPRGARP
jgi:dihydrofolate reductase